MAPSSSPLRLQVRDRVIVVLQAITAGSTYWTTPSLVSKSFIEWAEEPGNVKYVVYTDVGPGGWDLTGHKMYDEIFHVIVGGAVYDSSDPVSVMEKCIEDVRLSIVKDATAGGAGSLLAMSSTGVVQVRPDGPPVIDAQLAVEGKMFFFQPFLVHTTWSWT